jgi:hypothetical protein
VELQALLMAHWDPIGVQDEPDASDEYDSYVNPLLRRLDDGADADSVAEYLAEIESRRMGLPALPEDRFDVAERIVIWYRQNE